MNKKLGPILFLILLFMIPFVTNAESKFTVKVDGETSASTKQTIEYNFFVNSSDSATDFETTLKYDTEILELINITKKDSWVGNNTLKNSGNVSLKFTSTGSTGESNIFSIKFRVKSSLENSTVISFEDTKLTITSETETDSKTVLTAQNVKKEISIKSDDNSLKAIKIDGKNITGFSSGVYKYSIEVDALTDSVSIDSTLSDEKKSSYEKGFGNRKVTLKYGENTVLLKIKSESGNVATYTLKIIRKDDRVANTDLKSIIINGGKIKIDFDKNVLSYTVKTFKLETIDIDATADDSNSKVEVDAPKKLVIGDNKVRIIVIAVTGDKKEYNILINNTEVPTDTRLKNLSVKGQNIGFSKDKMNYTIIYDKSFKSGLTIYNTTVSNDVKVEINGNSDLKPGSVVRIIVNALDESSSTEYTITLKKDSRINFFLILDLIIGTVLIVLIIMQLKKKKKVKKEKEEKIQKELEKTKEIKL